MWFALLRKNLLFLVLAGSALAGCASFPEAPAALSVPTFSDDAVIARDGYKLHITSWHAEAPQAVIIAVHGMNDYAQSFDGPGNWWRDTKGITVIAYDQRGFGRNERAGLWPGNDALKSDLRDVVTATHAHYGALPVFIVGHSMGAAVVMSAAAEETLDVNGVVLAAPAVWGGSELPILYRLSANLAASVAPNKTLTGERAARQATDNIDILRAMIKDPFVIKETTIKSILGVTRIMWEAQQSAAKIGGNVFYLYGAKDEIIPVKSMAKMRARLCGNIRHEVYDDGWHMVLRDLQAQVVWQDVAKWMEENLAVLEHRRPMFGKVGPAAEQCAQDVEVR